MANVQHAALTTTDLHEPKGAAGASAFEVYVADGAGSGADCGVGCDGCGGGGGDWYGGDW